MTLAGVGGLGRALTPPAAAAPLGELALALVVELELGSCAGRGPEAQALSVSAPSPRAIVSGRGANTQDYTARAERVFPLRKYAPFEL